MPIAVTRDDIYRAFPNSPRMAKAIEDLFFQSQAASEGVSASVDATQSIKDASVVTLSPNDEFANERVLAVDPDTMSISDDAGQVILALVNNVITVGGYSCFFNLASDTSLDLPSSGIVLTDAFLSEGPFADDAAAATGGVAVGRPYRKTGGTVAWRQA